MGIVCVFSLSIEWNCLHMSANKLASKKSLEKGGCYRGWGPEPMSCVLDRSSTSFIVALKSAPLKWFLCELVANQAVSSWNYALVGELGAYSLVNWKVAFATLTTIDTLRPSLSVSTMLTSRPEFLLNRMRTSAFLPCAAEPTTSPTQSLRILWKSPAGKCVSCNKAISIFNLLRSLRTLMHLLGDWRTLTFQVASLIMGKNRCSV